MESGIHYGAICVVFSGELTSGCVDHRRGSQSIAGSNPASEKSGPNPRKQKPVRDGVTRKQAEVLMAWPHSLTGDF